MKKTETLTIRLTEEEKEQIITIARKQERKPADVAYRLIKRGLKDEYK